MEKIVKQIKRVAKDTHLSVTEKTEMKSLLLQHVKENPPHVSVFHGYSIPTPFSIQNFRNKKTLSVFVMAGLLMGSTLSFAAENTAPGDLLYPIKVGINEQVRGIVAITPKAKADWEVQLAERRLKEMEKLAIEANISPEIKVLAKQNFTASSERVKSRILKLEEDHDNEDAISTAGTFRDMLRKHEETIDNSDNHKKEIKAKQELSAQSATTTSVQSEKNIEPLKDVREMLRETRDEAEKKHEELKEKYNKELNKDSRETPEGNQANKPQMNSYKENNNSKIDVNKQKNKNEEIRSSDKSGQENKHKNE